MIRQGAVSGFAESKITIIKEYSIYNVAKASEKNEKHT